MKKLLSTINTRVGLTYILVLFVWLKSMVAYFGVFNLRGVGPVEIGLMIVNPIGFTMTCFAVLFFIRPKIPFYISTGLLAILANFLLYLNILYYREFTDFITIDTMTGGAGMFQHGFDFGSVPVHLMDWIYWIDLVVIIVLIFAKRITLEKEPIAVVKAFTLFSLGLAIFGLNFWTGDKMKSQLILRKAQSDKTYIVRYLGLGPWMMTDGYYTNLAKAQRKEATQTSYDEIQKYIKSDRYLAPNAKMFGVAKNKNVIYIHLESFQQDLIDLSIKGKDGKDHVVTPFLNSLYHANDTFSFSNFFNQVSQGKTSDAENMLETSTFGLPAGSLFAKYGSTQTFQAMPWILNQTNGYSSAVFHGNVGSFYNRINTYKQMGYQNFFDQNYYDNAAENMSPWGIKDKLFFRDSVPLLEQMQQPFYVKYLTVTNHLTYTMDDVDRDPTFATVDSGDKLVDGYFETAHYLDQSVQQFYDYLKKSGLYDKSMIVLYGDHYGISGSDLEKFAPYIGIQKDKFTSYDDTMLQRTPFMINIPGRTDGRINNSYVGEIDVMPTVEHLLGVDTSKYIQFGQDVFASSHQDFVAFRNKGFVSPTITLPSINGKIYDTQTGLEITHPTDAQLAYIKDTKAKISVMLANSDKLNNQNLLKFGTKNGLPLVDPKEYDYSVKEAKSKLKKQNSELAAKSTSLISQNQNQSTLDLYTTDIPQVKNGQDKIKN